MSVDGIISQIERKRISSRREFDLMIATEFTEIVNFDMFFFSCYVFQQQPRKNKNIHIEICRHSIKLLIFFCFLEFFYGSLSNNHDNRNSTDILDFCFFPSYYFYVVRKLKVVVIVSHRVDYFIPLSE